MNEVKLHGAMGFAMRAGKCVAGDFAAEKAVKGGSAKLVLLDESASDATKERYVNLCGREEVPCLLIGEMGRWIGKDGRMVAAVTDAGFAQMIRDAYASDNHGN